MKNSALTGVTIYCKNCKYRYTEDCPMRTVIFIGSNHIRDYVIDKTEDYWFCSEGEENDQ